MARSRETENLVPHLLSALYGISNRTITRIPGGRLSDTFKVSAPGEKDFFLKISRQIEPNTPFSTSVTEVRKILGFPFPQTYPGSNGKLYQTVPASIHGQPVPSYLQDMTTTLVDFYPMPDPLPESYTLDKFREMGRYIGKYMEFTEF